MVKCYYSSLHLSILASFSSLFWLSMNRPVKTFITARKDDKMKRLIIMDTLIMPLGGFFWTGCPLKAPWALCSLSFLERFWHDFGTINPVVHRQTKLNSGLAGKKEKTNSPPWNHSTAFSTSPSICVSACTSTEPQLLRLFLLLLSLVKPIHLPTQAAFPLVQRAVCRSTSVRLAAFHWLPLVFFLPLRGGGSEPLCPRSGTFLAKFSTV